MRRRAHFALGLWVWMLPAVALAQAAAFFGSGEPMQFHEEKIDHQFLRTRLGHALSMGNPDPNCVQLLGGVFMLLAETAPRLHKRDENFYLDPPLLRALATQLSPGFPASRYLGEMVRRVLIDGRMPADWLIVAERVNMSTHLIDLAKLKYLADGPNLIDSLYVSMPVFMERHRIEVEQANSSVSASAERAFRDAYLDHALTWGGLTLLDIVPVGDHKKHPRSHPAAEGAGMQAILEVPEPPPPKTINSILHPEKPKPTRKVFARLAPHQYLDLQRLPKGVRLLVRGQLYDFNPRMDHFEFRDALLFEDRDFSQGIVLADPSAVARCALAQYDLELAQPGGYGQH
jgi:hypothetical protein